MRTFLTTVIVFLLLQSGMCLVVQAALQGSHADEHTTSSMMSMTMSHDKTHDHPCHPCSPEDQGQPSQSPDRCCTGSVVPSSHALDGEFLPIGGGEVLTQAPVIYPVASIPTTSFFVASRAAQRASVDLRILYASFLI